MNYVVIFKTIQIIYLEYYLLELSLAKSLKISRYSQISVTKRPKAPYHSIYFGAPFSDPSSIKSKSKTKLRAAMMTTTILNPILIGDALSICMILIPDPKNPIIKLIK